MKLIVFNLSVLLAVLLVAFGVALEFGAGYGMIAAGALILGLTIYVQRAAGIKARRQDVRE